VDSVLACRPQLVGVKPALEVVPGMRPESILHAAPPVGSWDELSPLLQAALAGAAQFEGLSPREARLAAAQDHGAMAGGAGAITASTPVVVVEDAASGRRAFHFLMEGFGRTLILGMTGDDVFERLRWLRDEAGPAIDAALFELGGIDCDEIMVEALRRGDELHNRNAAATSLLAERLAPGLARADVAAGAQDRLFAFLRGNPQFFVAVSLAASKLMLEAGGEPALVTAMGANGRECGIKLAGTGDRWFTAPAEVPRGAGSAEAGPACGDSLLAECAGLGASVLPAAPALWTALGVDEPGARELNESAREIAFAEHPRYRVPVLADAGVPVGVDARRVAGTGKLPVIDIVLIHRTPGAGLVGLGLTSPPLACFEQALAALDRR
jgi:Protein of unknown function (DUF1116)